jgi:tetratricopeptide (TPR) repeat protein
MISPSTRMTLRLLVCAAALLLSLHVTGNARAQGSLEGEPKRNSPRPPNSPAPRRQTPVETPRGRNVEVSIITNLPGCRVFLNNHLINETDAGGRLTLTLRPGSNTIRAERPGYFPAQQVVTAPRATPILLSLVPRLFELKVKTTPPAAFVSIDGRPAIRVASDGQLGLPRLASGPHKVSVVLDEYITNEQIVNLADNTAILVTLLPDPVIASVREINRALAASDLPRAFNIYHQTALSSPRHPALSPALDAMLQQLQRRSQDLLQHIEPDGLFVAADEADTLQSFFRDASAWRAGDERLAGLADYWAAKNVEARSEQATSANEDSSLSQLERNALARVNPATTRQYDLVLYDMGWCYFRLGDADAAERLFLQARSQSPAWSLPRYALARITLDRIAYEADASRKRANLKAVAQDLDTFIASNPTFAQALAARALALIQLGEIKEASAYAQNAVGLQPSSAYVHFALSFILHQRGKTRDARREIDATFSAGVWQLDETSRRIARLMRDQIRN